MDDQTKLSRALSERFADSPNRVPVANQTLLAMAARGSCRRFTDQPVASELVDALCAVALASPSKSDLQQRDIVIVQDASLRDAITAPLAGAHWIGRAPVLLMFCANNRRQRQISQWRDKPFPNDHLDAFFNASVDAGIALSAFVIAAESAGLGCCPISEVRNHAALVSDTLQLPDHVFPIAGLALGWPEAPAPVSLRLPLSVTVHRNAYNEQGLAQAIAAYDARRTAMQPYGQQRESDKYGAIEDYGWSEDKARQYAQVQREDFGAFVRAKGFSLD